MFKIGVAGAGAMGGRIGLAIKEAGYNVTLIDDWEEHVDRINNKGAEVQTETKTYSVKIPAICTKEVSEKFDLIIILTKAMQAEIMLQQLRDKNCISKDTAILSMMNGLGHEERLEKYVPKTQIYLAVTMWTAGLRGPGQWLLEGEGAIDLQRADGKKDDRGLLILNILNESKLNAKISNDVFKSIWSKATLNSVLNPLCTILNKTIYEFGSYPESKNMVIPIIEEIVRVAAAKNIRLDSNELLNKIERAYPKEKQGLHYPSMHQDFNNNRLTEIDYLNGQIVSYGEEVNVPTPVNSMITHLIHQLEMKF